MPRLLQRDPEYCTRWRCHNAGIYDGYCADHTP